MNSEKHQLEFNHKYSQIVSVIERAHTITALIVRLFVTLSAYV